MDLAGKSTVADKSTVARELAHPAAPWHPRSVTTPSPTDSRHTQSRAAVWVLCALSSTRALRKNVQR